MWPGNNAAVAPSPYSQSPIFWPEESVHLRGHAQDTERKQAAIAELYETHFERVTRYIAARMGDLHEAEDLASEVFVRALRSADSYKETGAPMEAWIFRIAHNIVVDHLRKKTRRPGSVPIDNAYSLASASNPGHDLERKQEIETLYQSMQQLSEAQQQVLALRFGAEMSSEDMAQVLGKKPGAVREMQSAAIKRLRQIMQGPLA